MIDESVTCIALLAFAMAGSGFAFGLAYFVALRRTATVFAAGDGWIRPLALTLGRIMAAALFFTFAVQLGATSLLAAFAGFLMARATALRVVRQGM